MKEKSIESKKPRSKGERIEIDVKEGRKSRKRDLPLKGSGAGTGEKKH